MANKFRRLLIRLGKVLPFILCFIVCVSYSESFIALVCGNFIQYDSSVLLNTNISFAINKFIEYDWQTLIVLVVLSIALETCFWNRLSCFYLGINLFEKSYFDFELEPAYIYTICIINIAVSSYLTFKGIKIIMKK